MGRGERTEKAERFCLTERWGGGGVFLPMNELSGGPLCGKSGVHAIGPAQGLWR